MTQFIVLAALMLAAALAIVLRPLLGGQAASDPSAAARRRMQARDEAHAAGVLSDAEFAAKKAELGGALLTAIEAPAPRSRAVFLAAVVVALLVPALAIVLYRIVGNPQALNPAAMTPPPEAAAPPDHNQGMEQAIAGLAAKLKTDPNNAEGWALLGRAYLETQQFPEARDALKRAHELVKDDPDVAVAYAEAITLASDSRRFGAEGRALLDAALKTDPKNQRGIWLLGIADYQDKKYDAAIADWNRLLGQLPKGSTVEQQVKDQIARAEAERDGKPLPPQSPMPPAAAADETAQAAAPAAAPAAAGGPHLTVKVMLDPSLTAKVAPGDTVFVYAKAASGPPMPLAIERLHADQLPATVVLTDGMGMLPSMKLSNFPQVIIGARISKSGNAIAQSGDLQVVSKPLDVATTAPVELTIDQVVP
ncbi:MAG: c-type cytochrome biogenesis protein CcmI [Candidatus Eiseniibacteriota bacterium]